MKPTIKTRLAITPDQRFEAMVKLTAGLVASGKYTIELATGTRPPIHINAAVDDARNLLNEIVKTL